jgi:hypothetical protein
VITAEILGLSMLLANRTGLGALIAGFPARYNKLNFYEITGNQVAFRKIDLIFDSYYANKIWPGRTRHF